MPFIPFHERVRKSPTIFIWFFVEYLFYSFQKSTNLFLQFSITFLQ